MKDRTIRDGGKTKGRRIIWKILSVTAVILWAIVIFRFSAQQGTESSGISGRICYGIVSAYSDLFHRNLSESQIIAAAEKIQFPVRKGAHMSEYAMLALLLFHALCAFDMPDGKIKYLFTLLIVAVYAASDEMHQLFIPGRAGSGRDVLIDTAGGAIMLLIIFGIRYTLFHRKNVKESKSRKEKRVAQN